MGYTFDSDQLPELPDPGPRDGRHGVDRDDAYDPFPAARPSEGDRPVLRVSVEDAKRHLSVLLQRVETGEDVVLTRNGRPVARLVDPEPGRVFFVSETIVAVTVEEEEEQENAPVRRWARATRTARSTRSADDGDQLPALPDAGPRDGRHGVDGDRGYPFGG